jgi:hypothetical protein
MAVFVVFEVYNQEQMQRSADQHFPGEYLRLPNGSWLLAGHVTVREVTEKLGMIDPNAVNGGIIFTMASYYGRYGIEVWEWIKTRYEKFGG